MRARAGTGLALTAIVLVALSGRSSVAAEDWPGCDSFDTQPDAQAYWESHGRPAVADGDGDGRVCESLPHREDGDDCTKRRTTVEVGVA